MDLVVRNLKKQALLIEMLLYGFASFLAIKLVTVLYITLHNLVESEQWSYSLIFRNQDIVKTFGNMLSPIIFAPLFETIVFCVLLNRLCRKMKVTDVNFIVISASLFGAFHLIGDGNSWYTFSFTFAAGLIFAYCYNRQNKKYGETIAYFFTCLVHALSNGLSAYI